MRAVWSTQGKRHGFATGPEGRYNHDEDRDHGDRSGYEDDASNGGSSFHMKVGDAKIDVRCGPRETLKECVDAATTLLDKARSLPVTGSANTGSGNALPKPAQ